MTVLYPLRFEPIYKDYLWGGRRFESVLGRRLEPGRNYAESWEIADLPEDRSLVAEGPLRGKSLSELVASDGESLLGKHAPQPRFPLLLKYLDAQRHLSLQVHPDDALAARMGLADPGKTEAWYILDARPGSCLWAGLKESVDRRTFEEGARRGDVERFIHRIEPKPGECLFLPAGTVHALGAGLLVVEIQQPSDNTFRLSDWGRQGPDGKPRPLHVEEGLQAIDYESGPAELIAAVPRDRRGVTRLVECEKFVLDLWQLEGTAQIGGEDRCVLLTVVEGAVEIEGDLSPPLRLGQTILLPAGCGPRQISAAGGTRSALLAACLP